MPDALTAYRAASWALVPLARLVLLRRRSRGKEHPQRWREKLGHASAARPGGPLVWLHAVGLGEVMALRALFPHLAGVSVLVTTGTRAAGEAISAQLPANAVHQFLPIDAPPFVDRFLEHWAPDVSVWCEQEVWPGFVQACRSRKVPLAMINARLNEKAFLKRRRFSALAKAILSQFEVISAQESASANFLTQLGGRNVTVGGSLKPAAPPLPNLPEVALALPDGVHWIAVSTHPEDEAICLNALVQMGLSAPPLIIAPRYVDRAQDIERQVASMGLADKVHVVEKTGQLGGYFPKANCTYIGGTQSDIEGHNPWEAARLGLSIVHGPRVANFEQDYQLLGEVATIVESGEALADFVAKADHGSLGHTAQEVALAQADRVRPLAEVLVRMATQ